MDSGIEVPFGLNARPFEACMNLVPASPCTLVDEQDEIIAAGRAIARKVLDPAAGELAQPIAIALDSPQSSFDEIMNAPKRP